MVACIECGKRLGFFEGHYHPTLGKKSLVCSPCFLRVEESVAQWREFVLSNSFNRESSKSTLSIDQSTLFNRVTGIKKQFAKAEETHYSQTVKSTPTREMTLNHLNYHRTKYSSN